MRNLKKFLALVLSVMMVMSLFVTASAKSIKSDGKAQVFNDAVDVEFQEAIDVLNGMEVLKGDANPATGEATGNFRPNDTITRAEVAALVFRLSTGKVGPKDADHYAQYGSFSDVDKNAWYAGYVGYCANAGYIKGYAGETGPFGPSDPVTGYQALAMILRAMGYGVNGEFEGADWRLNVSKVGTQTGILAKINNSHFSNETLYGPAPRQVVAEIYFEAAQTDCVVYTPAFGYQTTDIYTIGNTTSTDNGLTANSSLGRRYFGLTKTTRVVLGNQATGESCTVLGTEWDPAESKAPYAYPGSWTVDNTDHTKDVEAKGGLNLKVDTDLMWFGHKVTAYYNIDSVGAKRTYAIYDKATYTYVYSEDGNILSDGTSAKLGGLAEGAKYAVDKYFGAHVSDRFSWISTGKQAAAAQFTPIVGGDGYDPYLYNNGVATTSKVDEDNTGAIGSDPMPYGTTYSSPTNATEPGSYYLLINNGNGLDVVITVAPELERITEQNTTASVNTYRLSGLSDKVMGFTPTKPSTFGLADDGIVRKNSVTEGSDTTLGHLVVGWEIKGTNYSVDYKNEIVKGDPDLYNYYLQPIAEKVTGTVKYYNGATGEVTLTTASGDKTLKWTRLPIINDAVTPPVDGASGGDGLPNAYFYNGETYTFSIDPTDSSRYVDWSQGNDYEFLYATYGDYDMGGLGSAELGYYVTGVNWNGEIVENKLVKSVTGDAVNGNGVMNGNRYEALSIAKKNLGGANNTLQGIGNEIANGYYTGYGYNAGTNDLDVEKAGVNVVAGAPANWTGYWDGYAQWHKYWDGKLVDTNWGSSVKGDNNGVWTIDKGNVADGWADQSNAGGIGKLLLTPNTKFILVSGVGLGSSNKLTVEIKNGIGDLLGASNDVRIDVKRFNSLTQMPDYNVYYQLFDEEYNNWYKESNHLAYTDDNQMVKTVILPKDAVTWSDNSNLWFTNKQAYNGIFLAGTDAHGDIQQLTMWRNGVKQDVFVDTTKGSLQTNPISNVDSRYGMFFKLTESYKVGTTPIYEVTEMQYPELDNVYWSQNASTICNLDLQYEYTAVNGLNTARLKQLGTGTYGPYTPQGTNNSADVYNVTDANVTNLTSLALGSVQELSNAASIGYKITVSIVNDGHRVTQIYVTDVQAPGQW